LVARLDLATQVQLLLRVEERDLVDLGEVGLETAFGGNCGLLG
jgi:hypothetical protein